MSKPENLMKTNKIEITDWTRPRHPILKLVGFLMTTFGVITLGWVAYLVWHDITIWNKDIALILFGSRTSEHISLGIGMKVIHYLLISLTLLLLASATLLRGRRKQNKCPHHFGYLARLPENAPIPQECLFCARTDCMETQVS